MSVWARRVVAVLAVLVVVMLCAPPGQSVRAQVSGSVAIEGDTQTRPLYTIFFEPVDGGSAVESAWDTSSFQFPTWGSDLLPAGEFRVRFRLGMLDGVERYFVAGQPAGAADASGATIITIGGAQPPPPLTMVLPQIGRVVGQVTQGDGTPLAGVHLEANKVWPHLRALTAITDATGHYDLGYLQAGERVIDVFGHGDLAGVEQTVTVPETGTINVDLALTQPAGRITGTITDQDTGRPISYASLYLSVLPYSMRVGWFETDAKGHYELSGLRTGEYSLQVSDQLATPGWGGAHDSPIEVTQGETTTHDVLLPGVGDLPYDLAGTVTDDQGEPVPGIEVTVESLDGEPVDVATTNRAGTWLSQVSDGDYRLRAAPSMMWERIAKDQGLWSPQYYPDTTAATNATTVTVSDQQPVDGLDMTLHLGALVLVAPQHPTGEPVNYAGFEAWDPDTGLPVVQVGVGLLDPDPMRIRVPSGSWKVLIRGAWELPQWYGGGTSFDTAPTLTLAPGEIVPLTTLTLPDELEATREPRIIGRPKVGRTLRVTKGQWNLMTRTTFRFQWYRGSTPISTEQRHTVGKIDSGHMLTAVVYVQNEDITTQREVTLRIRR